MTEPNDQQQDLIDSTQGIHVVDAGGTGKTFTVTRRYAEIVDQDDVEPEDVLLVTFTNNAATEMRERIVANCEYGMRELADAPIQTFHSLCHDILMEHGFEAPTLLGIDDRITGPHASSKTRRSRRLSSASSSVDSATTTPSTTTSSAPLRNQSNSSV